MENAHGGLILVFFNDLISLKYCKAQHKISIGLLSESLLTAWYIRI